MLTTRILKPEFPDSMSDLLLLLGDVRIARAIVELYVADVLSGILLQSPTPFQNRSDVFEKIYIYNKSYYKLVYKRYDDKLVAMGVFPLDSVPETLLKYSLRKIKTLTNELIHFKTKLQ